MRALLHRLRISVAGTAATEFAFIAPVLLLILGGAIEFGRALEAYAVANRLAAQYAIVWADCSDNPAGTCSGEASNLGNANTLANVAPQLTASQLTLTMFEVQMTGSAATVVIAYPATSTLSAAQTTAAQAVIPSGQYGVVVTVTYAHTLNFFSALMTPYLASHLTAAYTIVQDKT